MHFNVQEKDAAKSLGHHFNALLTALVIAEEKRIDLERPSGEAFGFI